MGEKIFKARLVGGFADNTEFETYFAPHILLFQNTGKSKLYFDNYYQQIMLAPVINKVWYNLSNINGDVLTFSCQ